MNRKQTTEENFWIRFLLRAFRAPRWRSSAENKWRERLLPPSLTLAFALRRRIFPSLDAPLRLQECARRFLSANIWERTVVELGGSGHTGCSGGLFVCRVSLRSRLSSAARLDAPFPFNYRIGCESSGVMNPRDFLNRNSIFGC